MFLSAFRDIISNIIFSNLALECSFSVVPSIRNVISSSKYVFEHTDSWKESFEKANGYSQAGV